MNKELKDKELENVNGGVAASDCLRTNGTVTLHNMPEMPDKEKYVMGVNPTDINIINTCRPTTSK